MKSSAVNRARSFGFLGGLMLAMAAAGVFWLITPMAQPDATTLQALLVIAQVVLGVVLSVWCWVAAGRVGENASVQKEDLGAPEV
jgi:hypothetical protein